MFHVTQTWLGAALDGRGILAFAVYGVCALLAGALLHYAVERPFLRLRGRVLRRRSSAVVFWPNHWNGVCGLGTNPPRLTVTLVRLL